MKKQDVPAVILLAVALVIAVGSQTFLSPCAHEDGTFGPCHWAGRALLGLGCLIGAGAVLYLLTVLSLLIQRARFGAYLCTLPVCVLGILTPGTLIDLCHMSTMHCRMVMQPAMMVLFCLAMAAALLGVILTGRKQ